VRAAGHRPEAFGSDQLGVHLQMLVLNPSQRYLKFSASSDLN
jgi:hypothetical protein